VVAAADGDQARHDEVASVFKVLYDVRQLLSFTPAQEKGSNEDGRLNNQSM